MGTQMPTLRKPQSINLLFYPRKLRKEKMKLKLRKIREINRIQ